MALLKDDTYQDILDLPEHLIGELVDGRLYAHARPAYGHVRAASRIGYALMAAFDGQLGGPSGPSGPGGWWILPEPELHFGRNVFVPDLTGWRISRLPQLPKSHYCELPPDWVCEVLSPSTTSHDRVRKSHHYAANGIPYLWFVDPAARTLEVLELIDGRYTILRTDCDDALGNYEPFEAVPSPSPHGGTWAGPSRPSITPQAAKLRARER